MGKKNYLIPKYPILIGNNINEDYYVDIYKYLYVDKYNLNTLENINDIINKKIKHKPEQAKLNFINSENSLNKHKLFISKILRDKFETKINNNNFTQKILIYNTRFL